MGQMQSGSAGSLETPDRGARLCGQGIFSVACTCWVASGPEGEPGWSWLKWRSPRGGSGNHTGEELRFIPGITPTLTIRKRGATHPAL